MSWLLDTNVVSQFVRQRPDERAMAWLRRHQAVETRFHVSAVSIAEMRRGALLLPEDDPRRVRILNWLDRVLLDRFGGRILPFDLGLAWRWAEMSAALPRGYVQPTFDSMIAATALHHGLTLLTRNTADFRHMAGLKVENPFA